MYKFALCIDCWGRGSHDTHKEYDGHYDGTTKCRTCRGQGRIPIQMIIDKEQYKDYIIEHCMNLDGFPLVFRDILSK